jgi:FMN phosphatase YigB (HAD superfamily)
MPNLSPKLLEGTIKPTELGFDFDGVIADTAESFLRLACIEYGLCDFTPEDITHFDLEQCLALDSSITKAIFTQILEDALATGLQPLPGAIEVLSQLAAHKTKVRVITARPFMDPVLDWFASLLPSSALSAIHVLALGEHDAKLGPIHEQGLRYFVDDRPETCVQLQEAGVQAIVFRQPWNRLTCSGLPSVNSWEEIRKLVDWSAEGGR